MYRVMIVDDEPLILAGIISMLEWENHDCKIVGKANNGVQALAQIEELRPDIIITDIKMPAMDGITFMREIRKTSSDTAFILLTNLEEFAMAREALALGASAYLVKLELTEESLVDGLNQAKNYCDVRRKENTPEGGQAIPLTVTELTKNYFQRLMLEDADYITKDTVSEELQERFREPVLVLINFNYRFRGFSEEFTRDDQKKVMSFAENIITEMMKGFFDNSCLVRRELNSVLLVLSACQIENYRENISSMSEKIISVIKDYFEVTVSVAVSRRGESILEFGDLLYQAMNAMNNYYYDTSNPILFYSEEFETGKRHNDQFNISFLKKDLTQLIRQNDSVHFQETIEQLIHLFEEAKPSKLQAINACSNLYYFISSFFEEETETDFPFSVNITEELNRLSSLEDITDWISWFGKKLGHLLDSRKNSKTDKIMILVQEYVQEHYKEKLTLGQVAEALNISQGYLSSSFKKQYGSGFSEYVAEVKVRKAQELIATHQYLMYEVSDMVGFDTQYYFSTVFKKVTGCSPKEYEMSVLKHTGEV